MKSRAASVFLEIAERHFLLGDQARFKGRPGLAFDRLPAETKELLKELKSDDLKDVRWPPWK